MIISFDKVLPRIIAGFKAKGQPIDTVTIDDLSAVDEFHIGGVPAALSLFDQLDLESGDLVVDIGCGLGGPARVLAAERGCRVLGIDLTPEYISAGNALSSWPSVSMHHKVPTMKICLETIWGC